MRCATSNYCARSQVHINHVRDGTTSVTAFSNMIRENGHNVTFEAIKLAKHPTTEWKSAIEGYFDDSRFNQCSVAAPGRKLNGNFGMIPSWFPQNEVAVHCYQLYSAWTLSNVIQIALGWSSSYRRCFRTHRRHYMSILSKDGIYSYHSL